MTAALSHQLSRAEQLSRYLQAIAAGGHSGQLLEIRYAIRGGDMARLFVPPRRVDRAARIIRSLAPRTDVYCGVLLRTCRAGGRDAAPPPTSRGSRSTPPTPSTGSTGSRGRRP